MKFANQLKQLRKEYRLTQRQAADMLGCSEPRISEWERGIRTPKPITQKGIIDVLVGKDKSQTKGALKEKLDEALKALRFYAKKKGTVGSRARRALEKIA